MRISRRHVFMNAVLLGLFLNFAPHIGSMKAKADPVKWTVDPRHTSVFWAVWRGGLSRVKGQFRRVVSVEFVFDSEDVSKSKVIATVDPSSFDSNHYLRDHRTRQVFLDASKYREIKFESTRIWKTGANAGKMMGNVTLHGVTKPVTFDVTYNKSAHNRIEKYTEIGFSASGTIKRSEFGVTAFIPFVSDEVEIEIEFLAHR